MNILGIAKFLQKRPKDRNILIFRSIFGLILIGVLTYNFFFDGVNNNTIEDTTFWISLDENAKFIFKCIITGFGIFPLFLGITNLCIAKKKIIRIMQIIAGILLIYFSILIKDVPNLDIDTLLFIAAFLPIFAGITGKCITSKCLKYGEKIKKIRV